MGRIGICLFSLSSRWGRTLIALGRTLLLIVGAGLLGLPLTKAAPPDSTRAPLSTLAPEAGSLLQQYVSPDAYGESPENWDAAQDGRGLFYVGNSNGVLVYDGRSWRLEPIPNRTAAKSLARSEGGTVFVGAEDEFGAMRPDSMGRMRYASLLDHVPEADSAFGEVRRVATVDGDVYFMSPKRLFRWTPQTESMTSWAADRGRFTSLDVVRGTPHVAVDGWGLAAVAADTLRRVRGGAALAERGVTFARGLPGQGLLVGTKRGPLVRRGDTFEPFASPDAAVQNAWARTAARIPDGTIAVATIRSGIFLLAPDGTLRRHLPARDNPTLGLHLDREGGLWALQYGGMIRYDVGASVTVHDGETGLQGTPTEIERHRGVLHVATTRSLYRLRPDPDSGASFEAVPTVARVGDEVQCWVLLFDGDQTFVGTTQSLARMGPNDRPEHLTDYTVYDLIRARADSSRFYAATSRGLRAVRRTPDGWTVAPIRPGFEREIRHLLQDSEDALWAASGRGVYRFQGLGTQDSVTVASFGQQHGLPEGAVWLYRWQGEIVFGTSTAPMRFQSSPTPRFTPLDNLEQPPGVPKNFVYLGGSTSTKAWGFSTEAGPGRWVRRDSTWRWRPGSLARFRDANLFATHVEGGGEVVWFGTRDGRLLRHVPEGGLSRTPAPARIRAVRTLDPDSTITADGSSAAAATLPFAQNSLRITYGAPTLVETDAVRYQYRLEGTEATDWSDWTARTEQTYRNLSQGTHTVAVRARTAYGDTTATARYAFTVLPPWYRTWWAYGGYLLAGLGAIAGVVRWRTWQLRRRRNELEATVRERTREIEEQKERLEELDEAKSRFFANVSHEFRTPITLIQGPARDVRERLQRGTVDPEAEAEQLAVIERNAGRLLRLVDQILGIARLEAGTYELDARPTDLGAEVERVARTFEPLAEREKLTLTVESSSAPPDAEPIYVDRQALEHVLSNLLSNAIKFTPEGGRVEVTVTERPEAVEVAVADTGPGIPAEEREAIFDRFQQVDDTSTRPQEGAGIGLAFAADLVDLHGGTIDLESTEGEGTTFTVRLPRGPAHLADEQRADGSEEDAAASARSGNGAYEPSDEEPTVPPAPAPSTGVDDASGDPPDDEEGKRVLVVDDNREVRRYVRSILEPTFSVVEAADGAEGVAAAREHLPDVILADVMMPSVDGHEMTQRLKQDPETEAIPVIMVTARAGTDDEVEGLQIGADDYVTKPFDADVLRQRVEGVVALQQRLRDRLREELQDGGGDQTERTGGEDEQRSELEQEARRIIREHLTDTDFDTEALAEAMAMSRATLYRRFKENVDQTPADLITAVRMDEAETLLRNGEGNVTQVAYAVGYDRLAAFSRAFREYAGHPPSDVAASTG